MVEKLIKGMTIPPPIHVGFAQAERTFAKDARIEFWTVNDDVPRAITADSDVGVREERFCTTLQTILKHLTGPANNVLNLANRIVAPDSGGVNRCTAVWTVPGR